MMKKTVLTVILAGLSGIAAANGWYVQGDVGASKLQVKESVFKVKDTNPSARIAVGKDTGALRYALDYTYFGKLDNHEKGVNRGVPFDHKAKMKVHSVGLSAIYDFENATALTPYVGARLGLNIADADSRTVYGNSLSTVSETSTTVGIGGLAGAQYQFTDKLAANAGLEYNYLGKIGANDGKVSQYGANVGLRYNF
ncbi:opacity family porin [Neisseria animalis]|uniref:Porin opacity type domain-containing protein n=1 Tax=Neisseria animalis TaxID=492 RepID=A0A5P3MSJ1_NEIAN|nr:opacity family porin [Neisseria animalis]QEY24410.1 hypothetical protein D0T90_07945 [Neisseria animalis]ROW31886.1 hypothetical protein CGZ60_07700 [Neisseria animalis]VEE06998.1 outer membrane protein [Neisseria animalis]